MNCSVEEKASRLKALELAQIYCVHNVGGKETNVLELAKQYLDFLENKQLTPENV